MTTAQTIATYCNLSKSLIDHNPRSPCQTLCLCRPREEWENEVTPVFSEEEAEWNAYGLGYAAHQHSPNQNLHYCMPTANPAFLVLLQQQGTDARDIGVAPPLEDYGRSGKYAAEYRRGWRDRESAQRHINAKHLKNKKG